MKANETPEKIYLSAIDLEEVGHLLTDSNDRYDVEYTRTDAFIEKVESFLNKKDDRDSYTIGYIKRHLKEIIKEVGL